jgi:hypothetical protein
MTPSEPTHTLDEATRRKAAKAAKIAKVASKTRQNDLATSKKARATRKSLGGELGLVSFAKQIARLEKLVRGEIATLVKGGKQVIAGPFLGEVGFELMYWIPLLRWAVREFPELNERLVIVSRGGTKHWYGSIGSQYIDTFSIWSVEEFHNVRGEVDKQMEEWQVEEDLQRRLRAEASLEDADVLHPSLLYTLYYLSRKIDHRAWPRSVVHDETGTTGLMAIYEPIPPPDLGPLEGRLPDDYVAVRFYGRPSFPDSPEARRLAESVIRSITRSTSVVLLNNWLELDDHSDVDLSLGDNVVTIDELMEPANNLHIQTIALSRARGFVGTYGGLSYLAPFLNVPSVGFSSIPGYAAPWHLDLAQRIFDGAQWGSLVTLRPEDLDLVGLLAG